MTRNRMALCAGFAVLVAALLFWLASSAPRPLDTMGDRPVVLVSNGVRNAFHKMRHEAEVAAGRPLKVEFRTAVDFRRHIDAGQKFDVALMPRNNADRLAAKGQLHDLVDFGRAPVGVEIRGDAPAEVDIHTAEGMKKLLLGAKQVRWLAGGASSVTIRRMLDQLGIESALAGRTVTDSSELWFPKVAGPGEYELVFNLNSELQRMNGWRPLGVFALEFQRPMLLTIGAGTGADPDVVKALTDLVRSPAFAEAMVTSGLFRLK